MNLRVLIDGLGLMGGSLAAALSAQGARVYCHHRRPEVAEAAAAKGWGHALKRLDPSLEIDLAITCVPVDVVAERVRSIHQAYPKALITDVGSTKSGISSELRDLEASGYFIGSHPMCGSHSQGLAAARSDLYQNATIVLCPHETAANNRIQQLTAAWEACGGRVVTMAANEHDRVVARVSHMPHILAALAARRLDKEAVPLAATGFRDTTRVAAGSPSLWNSILQENKDQVLTEIEACMTELAQLKQALGAANDEGVEGWLQDAQNARSLFDDYRRLADTTLENEG